jgi:hypothetical protein
MEQVGRSKSRHIDRTRNRSGSRNKARTPSLVIPAGIFCTFQMNFLIMMICYCLSRAEAGRESRHSSPAATEARGGASVSGHPSQSFRFHAEGRHDRLVVQQISAASLGDMQHLPTIAIALFEKFDTFGTCWSAHLAVCKYLDGLPMCPYCA